MPDDRDSLHGIVVSLLLLQRGHEARPYADRAVEHHPGLARTWANRGQVLRATGDLTGAEAAFVHALSLDDPDWGDREFITRALAEVRRQRAGGG